uniref:AAA domain protein n=1 Tax=Myoviridae sp. ctbEa13 TaxID=2825136 RepID=A0A8S5VBN5_9CAUD|nr:MAG TPA: AAA domain protein [Myoviridae sp. ctbEa13]
MKHFKMVLYGEPGVGKSTFACKAPRPFFVCTDGNYEWLEDFGAKEKDHVECATWSEIKKALASDFEGYDTVVLDLAEDAFKFGEYEFCQKNKINHISDIGYGKAYDITRNEFFIEMCKLFSKPKNVILIMHGVTFVVKDRRGVDYTKYGPSSRMPEKLVDMIEGRVRYFLRCYMKAEEDGNGGLVKKRYLSLIPKENEFGIARGLDETKVPHDIPLDFDVFAEVIGLYNGEDNVKEVVETTETATNTVEDETPKRRVRRKKEETPVEEKFEQLKAEIPEVSEEQAKAEVDAEAEASCGDAESVTEETAKAEVKEEKKVETPVEETKPVSNIDRLAAIKAKLAAMKNN